MRSQLLIAAGALAASVTGAAADSYACRSLNETDFPATANFEIRHSSNAYAVISAGLQIEGDIGYSTTATEPSDLVTVDGVDIDSGHIKFDLHQHDANDDGDVATLHVVTLSEGVHDLTGGVLQVDGGGLWIIQCDVTNDQPRDH